MKTKPHIRLTALLLAVLFLLPLGCVAAAADGDGFTCAKTAEMQSDDEVRIQLQSFQTGRVPAADIAMILDVSGSMEKSTPVSPDEIDGTKTYYIRYVHRIEIDGQYLVKREDILVHNTAPDGEEPTWYGQLEEGQAEQLIRPGDGTGGTYVFYTGAMEALRAAATEFVQTVARLSAEYEADHRVAVVEFSSPDKKNDASLGTHALPYYANILTGDGTPAGALRSAKDCETELCGVIDALTADGATYSDDAMTQAEAILNASSDDRRHVAILVTDGGPGSYGWMYDADNSALPTADGAIAAAGRMKQSGAQIYTIGVFNEENIAGFVGERNQTYLSLLSSDYPDAVSMDEPGARVADAYCSIGDLHMDLSGVFAGISAVLGVPVESAEVVDTLSRYFYLTDAQKQALQDAYPGVRITENTDGTTRIALDAVDFPPVAAHADGTAVDPQSAGIFTMTFDATRRADFAGGDHVPTNTGACGVFADGVQIASFSSPAVQVPLSASAFEKLLKTRDVTLYADQTLRAQDLYTDCSDDPAAAFVDLTYTVTGPDGQPFHEAALTESGDYTVTMRTTVGETDYSCERTAHLTVLPDTVQRIEIVSAPTKTSYFVGDTLDTAGMAVTAMYASGKTTAVTDCACSPTTLNAEGTQTITVSCTVDGVTKTATFTVTVSKDTLTKIAVTKTPTKTSYFVGDTLDTAGMAVTATYASGKTAAVTGCACSPTTLNAKGTQTITVSCTVDGVTKTSTFTVQVKPVEPVSAEVIRTPANGTFRYRAAPDFSGLAVRVYYSDGSTRDIDDLSQMTVRADSSARVRRGTQTFRVSAQGVSATFPMRVRLVWWQWLILIFLFGWIWY